MLLSKEGVESEVAEIGMTASKESHKEESSEKGSMTGKGVVWTEVCMRKNLNKSFYDNTVARFQVYVG
jgi:hypothetical protein